MKSEEAVGHQSNDDAVEDVSREEVEGEADEPDAPRGGEENEGMSTILSPEPMSGVQGGESEE